MPTPSSNSALSTQHSALAYAELHAHTNFSLLDGTSDPEDMARQAVALGLRALAITDHDSVASIVRFAAEAKRLHLHAIIGAEVTVGDQPNPLAPFPSGRENDGAPLYHPAVAGGVPPSHRLPSTAIHARSPFPRRERGQGVRS